MKDEQIKEMLKDNWIGKRITYQGKRYEVVMAERDRLQIIPTTLGFHSGKWVDKSEVNL